MIRLIARGIAAVLLELATAAAMIFLVSLALSAYLTARFIGVTPPFSRRTSAVVKFANSILANAIDSKRRMSADSDG